MRASKMFGALFAVALAGGVGYAVTNGLDHTVEIREPCKDKRLSYADQNTCTNEAQAAVNKDARNEIYDRYIAKAEAVEKYLKETGAAPTKIKAPGAKTKPPVRSL